MVEEEGLNDLDIVLAKMDYIAEFEKARIAEPMNLVMVMAATVRISTFGWARLIAAVFAACGSSVWLIQR